MKRIKHNYKSQTKICSKCKQEQPRTKEFFYTDSKNEDKLAYTCKKCRKKGDQLYRGSSQVHKDYQKSPEFVFNQLKYQAKKRNITFTLDPDYYYSYLIKQPCFYCGSTNTKHWIDRYDNDHTIGYTRENSVSCCEMCNKMKSHHTPEYFFKHCHKIVKHNI